MTTDYSQERHRWHDPTYIEDWIASSQTRDAERLPKLRTLARLIPFELNEVIRVLDVGSGYGLLTEVICQTFPNAQVVCHDHSEVMFSRARQRLQNHAQRISYFKGDLSGPNWRDGLSDSFHAVVSAIAIHNVRISGRVRSIYQEIFELVKEGGCFLNSELVGASGSVSSRFYPRERRSEAMDRDSSAGERSSRLPSVECQLNWLREAGFDEGDVFWKDMGQAIIGGYRSNMQNCIGEQSH